MADPRPGAVVAFLVTFDVKAGNTVLWSKCRGIVDGAEKTQLLRSLEFKAMPSGLHAVDRDVVYFSQESLTGSLLEGVAVYRRILPSQAKNSVHLDRSKVRMFSLGVLCPRSHGDMSSQNWLYVQLLDNLLDRFLSLPSVSDYSYALFDRLLDVNAGVGSPHASLLTVVTPSDSHPILSTTDFLARYGPTVFELWKSALLRQRILIVDTTGLASVEALCNYVYVLSVLATVPTDAATAIPSYTQDLIQTLPLYNITVSDISWLTASKPRQFIATTTDEVLLDKAQLYDIAIVTSPGYGPGHLTHKLFEPSLDGHRRAVPVTTRDRRRFEVLTAALGAPLARPPAASTPAASVSASLSSLYDRITLIVNQNAIYGLLWWASAGEQASFDTDRDFDGLPLERASSSSRDHLFQFTDDTGTSEPWEVAVIGYFQAMTTRLFETVASLIENQNSDLGPSIDTTGAGYESGTRPSLVVVIEPPDLIEMGLDPFSSRDQAFVTDLIRVWWNLPCRISHFFSNPCC